MTNKAEVISVLNDLKPNEVFYIDVVNFEKHQLTKNGDLARTFEYYKIFSNIYDTPQFIGLKLYEQGLYFRLLNNRAKGERPPRYTTATLLGQVGYPPGTSLRQVLDGVKKLEQNQLINTLLRCTPTLTPKEEEEEGVSLPKTKIEEPDVHPDLTPPTLTLSSKLEDLVKLYYSFQTDKNLLKSTISKNATLLEKFLDKNEISIDIVEKAIYNCGNLKMKDNVKSFWKNPKDFAYFLSTQIQDCLPGTFEDRYTTFFEEIEFKAKNQYDPEELNNL